MTLTMEEGAKGKTYKIGQAAKLLDVKPFVLRFWEGEFKDVLVPVRTPAGQRAYTEQNIAIVREIKRLLYDEGLTIEGAKKRLAGGPLPSASAARPRKPAPVAPVAPAPPVISGQALLPAAAPPAVDPAARRAEALAATLAEVARELTALRALLGDDQPRPKLPG